MLLTGLRALQVALGAVCLYLGYLAVSPAFGAAAAFDSPARASSDPGREPLGQDQVQAIIERDLFGGLAAAAPVPSEPTIDEDIKESTKNLKLFGTLVSSQPESSLATLFNIAQRESLFVRVHDSVDRCTIERIERKRVVLRCNDELEQIALDEESPVCLASAKPATPSSRRRSVRSRPRPESASARPASSDLQERLEKIRAARERNQEREAARARGLMQQAKITPKFGDDGTFEGIVLNDVKPDGPLAGIPDGTPCTEINGQRIGSIQDLAPVLQAIEGESVTLRCIGADGTPYEATL